MNFSLGDASPTTFILTDSGQRNVLSNLGWFFPFNALGTRLAALGFLSP